MLIANWRLAAVAALFFVGVAARRMRWAGAGQGRKLLSFVFNVGLPILVFGALAGVPLAREHALLPVAAICISLIGWGTAALVARRFFALPKTGEEELNDDGNGALWTMTTAKPGEKTHGKHPTQKPLSLLSRIVDACTEEDSLVLDPFCGSGTTGVAAVSKGRRFVGFDLDRTYLELTKKRLDAAK